MLIILGVSFLAFSAIGTRMQRLTIDPTFNRFDQLQLDSLREAYEEHGKQGLTEYRDRLNRTFRGSHYLLDPNGIDLITGEDRSSLLPPPPATTMRKQTQGHWMIAHRAPDGRYWFAAVGLVG